MGSPHVCGCDGRSASSHRQTLGEVDFERGIWAAARDGDRERVAHLLTRSGGSSAGETDSSGYTALHYAARAGHGDIVTLLLSHGADVNATTAGGATPLHRAAYQNHRGVVETLLAAGAKPQIQDDQGRTAAHKALERSLATGHQVLDVILTKHPDCANIADHKGNLPVITTQSSS